MVPLEWVGASHVTFLDHFLQDPKQMIHEYAIHSHIIAQLALQLGSSRGHLC